MPEKTPRRNRHQTRKKILLQELERRLLLSADVDPSLLDPVFVPASGVALHDTLLDSPAQSEAAAVAHATREVVVVDPGVDEWQQLVAELASDREPGSIAVHVLDAQRDGVEQLNEILARYANLDAVHLVSHGDAESLLLGATRLDGAALDARAGEVAAWGDALALDGDILLYGCDVASNGDGKTFVDSLSYLTGADVAASDDLTGHASLGGDWDLEYSAGEVEARIVFSEEVREGWHVTLGVETVRDEFNTSGSFAGNDGSQNFLGNWVEYGESDGAGSGRIRVDTNNPGHSGGSLQIDLDNTGRGVVRAVDLSGASRATLSFDWTSSDDLFSDGWVELWVSDDGGSTWNHLDSYHIDSDVNSPQNRSYDLTPYMSSDTQITFYVSDNSSNSFYVDNFEVQYSDAPFDAYADVFRSQSYSGSDGTLDWSGTPWQEIGESDGPGSGRIRVDPAAGQQGDALHIRLDDNGRAVQRSVDLTGANLAWLNFSWTQTDDLFSSGEVRLRISDDGGSTWTTIRTFDVDSDITTPQHESIEITQWANANTVIKFEVTNSSSNDFWADNFVIQYSTQPLAGYADQFNAASYAGSDGSVLWDPDWQEIGDGGGATGGDVRVASGNPGLSGYSIDLGLNDTGDGISRQLDLGSASWAVLEFDYTQRDEAFVSGWVELQISPDGGSSWQTLRAYDVDHDINSAVHESIEITDWATSNTVIRWVVTNSGGSNNFYIDNVSVRHVNYNTDPTANAGGPYVIDEGGSLVLDASASSDPDGDGLSYAWDLDNDGIYGEVGEPTTASPTVDWTTLAGFGFVDDGAYTIGVQVDDGRGGLATTTVGVTVNNAAPTGVADSGAGFITDKRTAFTTGNVLANDTDPAANDVLTVIGLDTSGTLGLVTDNGDGTFTYDPDRQFNSVGPFDQAFDTFSYTVSDGDGGTDTVTVTITINGRNDAPTADAGGPYAINEGDSLVLDGSASSDPDPDPLNYAWDLDNDGIYGEPGEPTTVGPTVDWATLQSFGITDEGSYTIGLRVDDGQGESDTATIGLTVGNTAPTAQADAGAGFTTDQNTAFTTASVLTNDSDPAASDPLSVTALDDTLTVGLVIDNGDGTFDYDPNGAFDDLGVGEQATDTFSYTVSDGDGGSDTATVTITINGTNDGPTADAGGPYAINEGDSLVLDASASSDPDTNDTLSYAWDLDNDGIYGEPGEPTSAAPTVDWTTLQSFGINDDGAYTLGLEVDDGNGGVHQTTVNLTVANTDPTAVDDSGAGFVTDKNTPFTTGSVLANDSDPAAGDSLSVTGIDTTGTLGLVVDNGDGTFDYDPNGQFAALLSSQQAFDSFSYTIDDGDGGTHTATVTITINGGNDAPTADAGGPYAINEGDSLVLDASASSDPDGNTLTYAWDLDNDGIYGEVGEPTSVGPSLDWATLQSFGINDDGPHTIGLRVDDGQGETHSTTTTVNVTNTAPVASADAGVGFTTDQDTAFTTANVLVNDSDASSVDVLSVTGLDTTGTLGLVVDNGDGTFDYDPNGAFDALDAGEQATDTFSYTVSDDDGGSHVATVTITIDGLNDDPTADAGGPYAIDEGQDLTLNANASSDPDDNPLSYAWDLDNDGIYGEAGEPTSESPTVTWATLQSLGLSDGAHTIGLQVDDSNGGTHSATTSVTITNLAPTATDDSGVGFTTDQDTAFTTANVLGNDSDPGNDSLSVTALDTTGTLGLVVDNGDGTFDYDPNGAFDGLAAAEQATDTFTYTVSDGDGGSQVATVQVVVDGLNDAPALAGFSASITTDVPSGAVLGSVVGSDIDAGDTLSYAIVAGDVDGIFDIDASGQIAILDAAALSPTATPSYSLTVEATDSSGATAQAVVDVDVSAGSTVVIDPTIDPDPEPEPGPDSSEDADTTEDTQPAPAAEASPPPAETPLRPLPIESAGSSGGTDDSERNSAIAQLEAEERSLSSLDPLELAAADALELDRDDDPESQTQLSVIDRRELANAMNALREQLGKGSGDDEAAAEISFARAEAAGIIAAAGLLTLLLRGGSLAALAVSTLPLWKLADPLAILSLSDEEREQIEEDNRAARADEDAQEAGVGRVLDRS